jgi:signal transduction histidine kinase
VAAASGPEAVAAALIDSLAPGAGIGLAVHDADLRMLLISPSLAELSGTPAEAQLGRLLTEALPGEVGEVAEASLRMVAATGEPLLNLEPAVEAGRERGWLISVFPLPFEGRDLIAVVALDVTASRDAQERLERSRRMLATAQRMAGVGSWSWDVDADRWTWSDELYALAGFDPAEPPPDIREVLKGVPPDLAEAILSGTSVALRDGQPYEISFPLELPDGSRRIIRGRGEPVRGPSGRVVRIDGFAQDVTELSRAEDRQRTAAVLGRLALSGMPIEALEGQAVEAVARELELDPAAAAAVLRSPADAPEAGGPDLVGDDAAAFVATVATIVANARERLRAEERVAEQSAARGRLVAQALDAEDRERRVISEALHDGPLQDLLALGHDVARLEPAAEGDAQHIERVRDGIARAVKQIREVMLDLHPVLLQVGGLESALKAICSQHARHGGFACEAEIGPGAAGPRDELVLSLVRELLRNVAKHAGATAVRVRVTCDRGTVVLEVTDDGVGIAPGRVREALGQGHIGLASSHERAEAIGGSLRVGARDDGRPGTQALAVLPLA